MSDTERAVRSPALPVEPRRTGFSVQLFAASATSPVRWRLLSGNNRECGRSADAFATAEQCLEAVTVLQQRLADAGRRNRRADAHRWAWELELDGRRVAASANSLDRLVRCEQAAVQFLTEFGAAPVRPGVVLSGARRWGSVA